MPLLSPRRPAPHGLPPVHSATVERSQILGMDMFCGAGGTSEGMLMAANELNADLQLIAINHWNVAIDTHSLNHPYAQHLCTGIDAVDPRKLVPGGRLQVLCASPECTHHSVARGGKPMSEQSRASGWHILRFAEALYIESIIIENVREFQSWGPIGANGRPLMSKRGQLFEQFIHSLKALGYRVEWKVLNCADYGDPTTRERLFIIARRGNKPIRWPRPTHMPASKLALSSLFEETRRPWVSAREIIDWKLPSRSIFGRKKPLAEKTLLRIEAGLRRFCNMNVDLRKCMAEDLQPFIVIFRNNQNAQSVDEPVPTVTANGTHIGLVEPFLMQTDQTGHDNGNGQRARAITEPVATIVTKANLAVIEPFLLPDRRFDEMNADSVDVPMRTVTATSNDFAMVEPFIIPHRTFANMNADSVDVPLRSITTSSSDFCVVEPFVVTVNHGNSNGDGENARRSRSVDDPMGTVTGSMGEGVCEPFLMQAGGPSGTARRPASVDDPMSTVMTENHTGICEPFLISYYGTQNISAVDEPTPTVTTKMRFGLVEPQQTRYRLDIRFRMLQPRELARAQGFPDGYKFTGNREAVVKQIGNAVPPNTAKALLMEVLN